MLSASAKRGTIYNSRRAPRAVKTQRGARQKNRSIIIPRGSAFPSSARLSSRAGLGAIRPSPRPPSSSVRPRSHPDSLPTCPARRRRRRRDSSKIQRRRAATVRRVNNIWASVDGHDGRSKVAAAEMQATAASVDVDLRRSPLLSSSLRRLNVHVLYVPPRLRRITYH